MIGKEITRGADGSGGSFRQDFDRLLKELGKPPIIELGKPEPNSKYLPCRRAAKCPATHNHMLIDGLADPLAGTVAAEEICELG